LVGRQPPLAAAYKDMPEHYLTYDEAEEAAENLNALELEKGRFYYIVSGRYDPRELETKNYSSLTVKRDGALTVADADNIVRGNFAPDIKKLVSELEAHLGDFDALRAFGARIVARYGHRVCREVVRRAEIIYGGRPPILDGIWADAVGMRKRTTKAEAVAQHIDALVKLLQNEPGAVVEPILDNLLKRINRERNRDNLSR
jgi:hypothetical protein